MKNLILNFLLAALATLLFMSFLPIIVVFTGIHLTFRYNKQKVVEYYSKFFRGIAISVDQFGNVFGQYLFNFVFLKKGSQDLFGDPDETISTVLYKNNLDNKLSVLGKIILFLLNSVDPGHGEKSFGND